MAALPTDRVGQTHSVVAMLALVVAGLTGCGRGGSDDPTAQLCAVAETFTFWEQHQPTLEEMATSDDEHIVLSATVVAIASTTRSDDFENLGTYEAGVDAVIRRGNAYLDRIGH